MVALDRCGNHSRSKRSRSNVAPKYASAQPVLSEVEGSIFRAPLGCLPLDLPRGGEPVEPRP